MIEATWTLNLLSGPVVGRATADTPEGAWAAVRAAWKAALGKSWGPDHEEAVRRLQAASRAPLATGGSWTHTSAAVVVSLRRVDWVP
jgi:hypothetical protein